MHQTTTFSTQVSNPIRLTFYALGGVLLIASIILNTIGIIYWLQFLQTGVTGLWCHTACDYQTGAVELLVAEDSPAYQAGIRTGDSLLAVDGEPIAERAQLTIVDPGPYVEAVPGGHSGEPVTVTIRHANGNQQDYTLDQSLGWSVLTASFSMMKIPFWVSVTIQVLPNILGMLLLMGLGSFLIWRSRSNWLAMTLGLLLLLNSFYSIEEHVTFTLAVASPTTHAILKSFDGIRVTLLLLMLYLLPNGRFVPRWLGYLAVPLTIYVGIISTELVQLAPSSRVDLIIVAIAIGMMLATHIYRYRKVSSPEERQQTKWLIIGVAVYMSIIPIIIAMYLLELNLEETIVTDQRLLIYALIVRYDVLTSVAFPVALLFSAARYRLWEIDFVINRSLVYFSLTILLGLLFTGAFALVQTVAQTLFDRQQALVAAAVASGLIAMLFNPTRNYLRRLVDRRLYGIELDYERVLKEYGHSVEVVAATSPSHASIGQFAEMKLIGRGGMGEVYLAEHPTTRRKMAIKILPATFIKDENARQRFMHEAQATSQLSHPNIVDIYDVGEYDQLPYMMMEYIEGHNLSEILKRQKLFSLVETLPILKDVAQALDYVHQQGIVHRDVKPSNVMLEAQNKANSRRAILMDFGVAHLANTVFGITGTGEMLGTLDYISPEQIRGETQIDGRTDVYSLGIMCYQMLTGELPFKHSNPGALVMAHMIQPPPAPQTIAPDLPYTVSEAIIQAMAKNPDDRFASAGAFVAALAG